MNLSDFEQVRLCHCPTPLEPLKRLSEFLEGPEIWIKRDDCTGLATGGNKTRKLEFLVGEAINKGADTLVTQGAVQSNHARQTAAAAAKFGLKCHILLERRVTETENSYEITGNVLLNQLYGASIEFRESGLDMNSEGEKACQILSKKGQKPYFIPGGGSNPVGALGYVKCALELTDQMNTLSLSFDNLIHATGSTGTQAGIVTGLEGLNAKLPVLGISVRQSKEKQINSVWELVKKTTQKLDLPKISREKILVDDGYVGKGYGIPNEGTLEAISILAQKESILLDPVYSGKGMAGLIDLIRKGFFKKGQRILFLHTGGSAALFAYEKELIIK
tara:strand:+ start:350 stop:1348 length:999 start_codon:yes stop_codon:yes gene_type:complete